MDLLKAVRILALSSVRNKDASYLLRFTQRWYRREFPSATQEEVDSIPVEELFRHFFEVRYENMDEEELEEEMERLCETPEETAAREAREKEEKTKDDDFVAQAIAEEKERLRKKGLSFNKPLPEPKPDAPIQVMGPTLGSNLPVTPVEPALREIPQDIKVEFIPEEDIDEIDLDNWDLMGPPKKG